MKIKLLTDSSSDLPLQFVKEHKNVIELISMPITIENDEYADDLGEKFSHDFFYGKLAEGVMPKTSQINTMSFYECFVDNHEKGYATLYLGLSSGLSGTYNNANLAKSMVLEEFPDAKIVLIDTVAGSIGLGALVLYGLELINEGKTIEEIEEILNNKRLNANHWFAVDDLMHLKNGGRIPAAVAYVGTVLNVKPILTMKYDGKLESYTSVRGKKKAYKYVANKAVEHIDSADTTILIGHANCEKDAVIIEEELRKQGVFNKVIKTCLSATIASHVGPGMLAVAFMGEKPREDK